MPLISPILDASKPLPINVAGGCDNRLVVRSDKTVKHNKALGAVYTPSSLALWLAQHLVSLGCSPSTVLDPAAGGGALLEAASQVFPKAKLLGFDLDKPAHETLLGLGWAAKSKPVDALKETEWFQNECPGTRLIFSNPPWGAHISGSDSASYRELFGLAKGSFDTFDVFIESTLNNMRAGDWAALFLPDSLLLPNHIEARRLIQQNSLIHSIVRLPEGVFPNVAMGCITLVLEKKKPTSGHRIKVSRIKRADYLSSKADSKRIEELRVEGETTEGQLKWIRSAAATWQINSLGIARGNLPDSLVNHNAQAFGSTWDLWFESGRGLEIGKKNLVKSWPPVGVSATMVPIAVGEDVNRRNVTPSRLLDLSKSSNLRLKNELDPSPRLLVRKTGIGIKAAVASGVVTTQTVYHFRPKAAAPSYALHYAAGFLTSRIAIAIHLAKTGETEWRSHPYVTQRVIRDLQLPIPKLGSTQEALAEEIAAISESLHTLDSLHLDDRLDYLVARMLGCNQELVDWSRTFLDGITGCTYTRNLARDIVSELSA